MSVEPNTRGATSAHVVVLGNEKGGAGKSTVAMHVAVALMNVGQRVATIDVDSRQRTFTRYMENRRAWARKTGRELKVPTHFCVARGSTLRLDENEAIEFAGFAEAVGAVERSHDFVAWIRPAPTITSPASPIPWPTPCWARATSDWLARVWRNYLPGLDFAVWTGLPSGWSTASFSHAA